MFKTRLIYFGLFFFVSLVAVCACWYGGQIGAQEMYGNLKVAEGMQIHAEIRRYIEIDPERRDKLEAELNAIIIEHGYYLEQRWAFAPFFTEMRNGTENLMGMMVSYRLKNPRIYEGVEYSPFKKGWKDYFKSLEPIQGQTAEESKIVFDEWIKEHEIDERRYKLVLDYYEDKRPR